jgi:hypothetical protein
MDSDVMRLLAHMDQTREEMRSIVRGMPTEQRARLIKTCAAGHLCDFDEQTALLVGMLAVVAIVDLGAGSPASGQEGA